MAKTIPIDLSTVKERLARVEEKQISQLDTLGEIKSLLEKQCMKYDMLIEGQNRRIEKVETDVSFVKGKLVFVFTAITTAVSTAVGLIVNFFSKK